MWVNQRYGKRTFTDLLTAAAGPRRKEVIAKLLKRRL